MSVLEAYETAGSRSRTGSGTKQRWRVVAESGSDVRDWVLTRPVSVENFVLTEWDAQEIDDVLDEYEVNITYGIPQVGSQNNSGSTFKFNFVMGGGKFVQSLDTIAAYKDAALVPGAIPDHGGAINVVNDGGKLKVEGVDVNAPHETHTFGVRVSPALFNNTAYANTIENLLGLVNSVPWKGRAAGSMIFCRCQGGIDASGDANLEFGFGYIKNRTGIVAGNITGIAKDGWDLMWADYATQKDGAAKSPIKPPSVVYIERLFERADFLPLGL